MKDAGIEAKQGYSAVTTNGQMAASLGDYAASVRATLEEAEKANVIPRIWARDASLWKHEESHQKIIANSLGWLTVPTEMLGAVDDLRAFAESVSAEGFQQVMVCGMGGSSLCSEVLRQTFGRQKNSPELLVLDSTDPDTVDNFEKQIDVSRCLFIIASKSGTTTEPIVFHKYWYHEVAKRSSAPGKSFIAITDPGTRMVETARAEAFRRIFLNQPDIGGRYSALSYFGIVPAASMGLDVNELLRRAEKTAQSCRAGVTVKENPAAMLGAIMASCARAGRDKLTIITDEKLAALGLWVEQLVAESTGKEGKGIVPVVGESLGSVSAYGNDRLFVSIAVETRDNETKSKLEALQAAGHPVVYRSLADLYDLGAEFYVWEMATAFAGWRLGINPFDQPNVQESKDATKALLEQFTREGKLPDQTPVASDTTLAIYAGDRSGTTPSPVSVSNVLGAHLAKVKPGDYVALLAYVEETPEIEAALQAIRIGLRDATGCATTTGYGPRYLHSTGQLHKGGPDLGVFIEMTAPDKTDLAIPGEAYSFGILKQAQAQGDFQSLLSHGRRAIRVDLGEDAWAGLTRLRKIITAALPFSD